jgi:hypothetical protein
MSAGASTAVLSCVGVESRSRLAALRANAEEGQWSAARDLDWSAAPSLPWWLPRRVTIALISQIYHGETASLRFCEAMAGRLGRAEAEDLLALQRTDEARHVEAYGRYLARLGDVAPPDTATVTTLDGAMAEARSPVALAIAFQIVLEGEALTIQQDLAEAVACPLLRALNARAARDEARHVAFGKSWLPAAVAALPAEERQAIFRWVRGLWHDCADAVRDRYTGISAALFRLSRSRMEERWRRHRRALVEIGLVSSADSLRL